MSYMVFSRGIILKSNQLGNLFGIDNMTIRESRYITINNKIITRADVQKLANVLYSLFKRRNKDQYKELEFSVTCEENAYFTSEDPKIFNEDSPINTKRVLNIHMRLYMSSGESIRIDLEHNPGYFHDNTISVAGEDSNWVNGTLKKLEEITDSFSPQNTFFRKYRVWLFLIFGLSLGLLLTNYIFLPLAQLLPAADTKLPNELLRRPMLLLGIAYGLKALYSLFWGAFPASYIVDKLIKLFPRVEIQIAPEHKLIEKRRRILIANMASITGVVSLLLQIVYEFAKKLF